MTATSRKRSESSAPPRWRSAKTRAAWCNPELLVQLHRAQLLLAVGLISLLLRGVQVLLLAQQVYAVLLDLLLQCHRSLPLGRLQLPQFGRPLDAVRDTVHPADYQQPDGVWSGLVRLRATVQLSMLKHVSVSETKISLFEGVSLPVCLVSF